MFLVILIMLKHIAVGSTNVYVCASKGLKSTNEMDLFYVKKLKVYDTAVMKLEEH